MEKQQYLLNLSLTQIALRKVAIILWNQVDILHLIKSFCCQPLDSHDQILQWRKLVESKVKEKVLIITLPDSLKEELMHVIEPIGPEILKWIKCHESLTSYSYFGLDILDQLHWTPVGTVDYRKTAEMLIRRQRIDIISSYKLACIYCLDDRIQTAWEKLSENNKKLFYDEENPLHIRQPKVVIFWTYLIKGKVVKLVDLNNRNREDRERTLYQYAFEWAAMSGNKVATEYFYEKLTFEEREASLLETTTYVVNQRCFDVSSLPYDFPKDIFCNVACYLLSKMRKEEQIEVFKMLPYKTLCCFIDWPWQDLLMKAVGFMWTFLPEDDYYSIIRILSKNFTMTGCNYSKLFEEFFLKAPSHFRNYIMRNSGFLFHNLVDSNNTVLIKLVLRNISEQERQGVIISENGCHICCKLLDGEKWSLLDLFISECRLSSVARKILTTSVFHFTLRYYSREQLERKERKFRRLFQLIDNANVNAGNKRIVEEKSIRNKQKRKK